MHWAEQYIGKPWSNGGRGPYAFDCWGLVQWIYSHHYGVQLPSFPGVNADDPLEVRRTISRQQDEVSAWDSWKMVLIPSDGCAVTMGNKDLFNHVGFFVQLKEGPFVLHCVPNVGVIAQPLGELKRAGTFQQIRFFKHVSIHSGS